MSLLSEKENLLETTAKVKYVREEVTRKLEQYRKDYDEMHIRAITAELEVSNLQMKLDQKTAELDSRQNHVISLIDQISKSQNVNHTEAIEAAKHNLTKLRAKLKAEFDKMIKNQKDLRIGINSFMRCLFEFRTGEISQNDFFCATDLIFSSLEANDRALAFSPSPKSKQQQQPSHIETVFNVSSIQELASLPPEQRRKKLEKIIDRLSPDLLLCPSTDDILNTAFDGVPSSKYGSDVPPLPARTTRPVPKPLDSQSKAHSSPNIPPPIPPRPKPSFVIPVANGHAHKKAESESDSDFERDDEIQKIRIKSMRFMSEPTIKCSLRPNEVCPIEEERGSSVEMSRPQVINKRSPMKRSRSCDVLKSNEEHRWSSSSDTSEAYSFPFEHIEAWRKVIGLRDSSILTGSLPHILGIDDEQESMCYITPNEFRSIVTRVRGESNKMGDSTRQRVIDRVDSFVTSCRRSRRQSSFHERPVYLSVLGSNPSTPSWLQKGKKKSTKRKKIEPLKPKNYENQSLKSSSAPVKKAPNETQEQSSPTHTSSGRFDDPKYDISAYSKDIYNIDSSPSPPKLTSPLKSSSSVQYSTISHKAPPTGGAPALPPKSHLVNVQFRSSKLFEAPPSPDNEPRPKPIPKPRSRKKQNLLEEKPAVEKKKERDSFTKNLENDPNSADVYFTLKHGTHSLQLVPQVYDSKDFEDEEEDPGDYSLGTFEYKMNSKSHETKLQELIKKDSLAHRSPVTDESHSSDSDDSDGYEIPPDAAAGYVERTSRSSTMSSDYSRDRKYTTTLPNSENETVLCEKKGYLHKLDPRLKHWTKRWFVLKGKELKYYSKKGNNCRAKGVINLAAWCKITRTEVSSSFQLATPTRTYHFVAESNTECDDWIKSLQMVMRMCQNSLLTSSNQEIPAGWAKVKLKSWSQSPQKMWIALLNQSLVIYDNPNEKALFTFFLVDAMIRHSSEVPGFKCRSGFSSAREEFTIVVEIGGKELAECEECINISLENKEDRDNWFYQLVSASSGEAGPELTLTEKLVCRLWRADQEGSLTTVSSLWSNPVLNHTSELIHEPLISLPSSALGEEATKMFKTVNQFISTPFDPLGLDDHIMSFQQLINKALLNTSLRDEVYCQVFRQISAPPGVDNHVVLQSWFLFALLIPHFTPERKLFQWYLKNFVKRQRALHGSQPTIVAQLANLCEERLGRVELNGLREKKPSWYELHSLMSRPIPITCYVQMKLQIPVQLLNDSTILIECDSCTTVLECMSAINQEIGMQDAYTTGFALMSDWPGEEGNDIFYLFPNSKLFDVISIWSDSLAEFGSSALYSRVIRLTYRNRISLHSRRGQESDKEAVLLAYQFSQDVLNDYYPVQTLDVAIDIAAKMAQIDYGDCAAVSSADVVAKDAVRRFCPIRFTRNILPHDMKVLGEKLMQKWKMYHGVVHHKCARMMLSMLADSWEFFGATLFFCRDLYSTLTSQKNANLWLAVHEEGVSFLHSNNMRLIVSYTYKEIATFGGHGDDFMLVVNNTQPVVTPAVQTEKIIIAMPKFKIREATYLMASYLDS